MSNIESDDDDDFGPVIPPPLKKERAEAVDALAEETATPPPSTIHATTDAEATHHTVPEPGHKDTLDGRHEDEEAAARTAWSFFSYHSDLPSAPLYDRCFVHDRPPGPRAALSSTGTESTTVTAAAVPSRVEDIAVLEDGLGAMVCSLDEAGVLRVWRMLPSGGLFFLGEQDRFFPAAEPAEGVGKPSYYVCVNSMMQWVVLVRVDEALVNGGISSSSSAAEGGGRVDVTVDMKRVNPLTLTVEAKSTCVFSVPATTREAQGGAVAGVFTRRPALLQHRYEPHLAFFVGIASSSSLSHPSTSPAVASGVVLFPCFPASAGGAGEPRMYRATRLSTANRVVACAQQPRRGSSSSAADAASSPALVLVDAEGIVDYATIEAVSTQEEDEATRAAPQRFVPPTSGLTLRIMAGLKAAAGDSAALRTWSRWIRFESRPRTGFFRLLRDAQRASRGTAEDGGRGSPGGEEERRCGAHVVPLGVSLSPTGRYFAISCLKLTATTSTTTTVATGDGRRRAGHACRVSARQGVYIFDFPTGQCIGSCDAAEEDAQILTEEGGRAASPTDAFECFVHDLASHSFAGVVVVESGVVRRSHTDEAGDAVGNGLYILTPVVHLASLSAGAAVAEGRAAQGSVEGRPVLVFQVAFPAKRAAAAAPQTAAAAASPATPEVSCFKRRIGQWEHVMAHWQGPPHPLSQPQVPASAPSLWNASASVKAPLVVLRRSVVPSQDLKNLLGRSPTGAALSAEELKKLVFTMSTPTQRSTEGGGDGSQGRHGHDASLSPPLRYSTTTDRLAVTTSWRNEALIVYLSSAATSTPETAHFSAINRSASAVERLLTTSAQTSHSTQPPQAEADGRGSRQADDAAALAQWREVQKDVHAHRHFHCGRLLTLSAQFLAQSRDSADVQAVSEATVEEGGEGVRSDANSDGDGGAASGGGMKHSRADADVSASTSPPAAPMTTKATRAAPLTPVEKEVAAVAALLKDALHKLRSSATPADGASPFSQRQPSAFLTVRGHGVVQLCFLPEVAPLAVQSFVTLARRGYYTGLSFHRVIPRMMIQGGCPRGDGTGGESGLDGRPTFPDENVDLFPFFSHTDQHLWLCMANAGKDTNGSQFFITVPGAGDHRDRRPDGGSETERGLFWLNGKHTVFGFVVSGANVVKALSEVPRDEQDAPLRRLTIERVDILGG